MQKKASTKDILTSLRDIENVPDKWRRHFKRLLALRNELSNQRADLVQDALSEQPAFSLHMADAGTDNFDRDFALGLLSAEQNALYEIEQALNRIKNGSYGVCEATGTPIERARLAAIPWTRFSAEAERALEKQGQAERRRLGPRQRITQKREGQNKG